MTTRNTFIRNPYSPKYWTLEKRYDLCVQQNWCGYSLLRDKTVYPNTFPYSDHEGASLPSECVFVRTLLSTYLTWYVVVNSRPIKRGRTRDIFRSTVGISDTEFVFFVCRLGVSLFYSTDETGRDMVDTPPENWDTQSHSDGYYTSPSLSTTDSRRSREIQI